VFLVADDATLAQLLEQIAAGMAEISKASGNSLAGADGLLALQLDVLCLQHLGKLLSDKDKLSQELAGVLTTFAGEAGRHAASVEEIVKNVPDRPSLQTRLVAENMIYLEESSPAARVRAYDWLRSQKRAPANFDPLASPRARRDALEKAMTPATDPTP
jgi:hypothetical protein